MYHTKQQEILMDYFKEHKQLGFSVEELFSVPQVCESMGKSTVYRLVEKLVKAQKLKRLTSSDSRRIAYQFMDIECEHHLHLICGSCGKMLHAENGLSQSIATQIETDSSFVIDSTRTILYGTCGNCLIRQEKHR